MSTKKNTVSTANTTTTAPAKGNTTKSAKGNTAPVQDPTTTTAPRPATKPAPVNWARLTESTRGEILRAIRAQYPTVSAFKKAENKTAILDGGVTVTVGDNTTVYTFNDRGYISLLKYFKDTRKSELKVDIKTLKSGYDFAQALCDRFRWAMGTPQYSAYCAEIARELGEVTPDTVQAWVDRFYPYQDPDHNIMFPVWVCPVSGANTPGVVGRCARMLLYPEQYTVSTAARVFSACIDNWGQLAGRAIGVRDTYTAPALYQHGTVLQVCKWDPTTGTRGDIINTSGADFVTAHGAGELTTVTRWRSALRIAQSGK